MAPAGWTDQVPVPRQHSNAAWAKVAPGRPDGGQPPTPVGAVSRFLLSRADHELVDGDATRARHTVLEDIGDVLRSEMLEAGEALHDVLTHRFPYLAQDLSHDGPGSTTATHTVRVRRATIPGRGVRKLRLLQWP